MPTKHGATGTPLYRVWNGMMARCHNPKHDAFNRYGGRGIAVDPAWHDFLVFSADMGPRPEGMTLERNDNDGPYTKANCRWATPAEQGSNKRNNVWITIFGHRYTQSQWARYFGKAISSVKWAFRPGRDTCDALRSLLEEDQFDEFILRFAP